MSDTVLPTGWRSATLGDLAAPVSHAITDGPFGSNLKSEHYTESGPRVIRLQNIGDSVFLDARAHIAPEHFEILRKHEAGGGDLVVAMLGERLPRACLVPPYLGPAIVKADCARVRLNREIVNPKYINWWLNSSGVQSRTTAMLKGVGRPRINLSVLRRVAVSLPPIAEQYRIVAKIEELFSDLDAGVAALTRVRVKLKRYRASVLKAAVEGRLTASWRAAHPDVEPAENLLDRILTERRAKWEAEQLRKYAEKGKELPNGWKAKYKGPFEPDLKVCPPLPAGWTWATVDACAWEVTVGHVGPMKEKYENVGFPFLRSQNVRPLRFDPLGLKFIPADFHAALVKSRLMGGELLVVRSGNVGEACVYPTDAGEANCADLVITRPLKEIVAQYLAVFVVSPTGIRSVLGKRTGSALPHFNVGAMARSPIPIPPFAEQTEIVAEVDRRLSVVDAVEAEVEHALQRAGRLRQSILKRAFEGGLLGRT